jgi:hypothetical protein
MIRWLRNLLDPRLALLLVPIVAAGVLLVVGGSGDKAKPVAKGATTTTVLNTESASTKSPITVPPKVPVNAPAVTAADAGDADPSTAAVRNRAATIRAARAASGDPVPGSETGEVAGALVQATTTLAAVSGSSTTTVVTTTMVTTTTVVVTGPDAVVSESGSPLVLLLVAGGCVLAAVGGAAWWRRRRARNASPDRSRSVRT